MAESQSPMFNPTEPGYSPNSSNTNSGNGDSSGTQAPFSPNNNTINTPNSTEIETGDNDIDAQSVSNTRTRNTPNREVLNIEGEIETMNVGEFPQDINKPFIRLFRDSLIPLKTSNGLSSDDRRAKYSNIYKDIPKYDLSKITRLSNPEIQFDFILCLKDGIESPPQLYATADFLDKLDKKYKGVLPYYEKNPIAVNEIIEEKNIVVVNIKPLKEKIEILRGKELSINLNRNEINGQVEVRRNLFVYSNYEVGDGGVLVPSPTYDMIELIKYISWVVTKPAANYDDRLIPTNELGDFDGYNPEEEIGEDQPSEQTDTQTTDTGDTTQPPSNQYPPIGRAGIEDAETVLKDGDYWIWSAEDEEWSFDIDAFERIKYRGG
jgi:hypothetical protein